MTTAAPPTELVRRYEARGGVLQALNSRQPEILVEGPAGTGKTRGILEKIHRLCLEHPGLRVLVVRKTLKSLATSALATFSEEVLTSADPVHWFGGSGKDPAAYRYDNGASITIGGMDDPDKILSSFYDLIYWNEATEGKVEEWELLTARLRHGVIPDMRIIGDCNPSFERHWLLKRCLAGQTQRIKTNLTDNPAYYNLDGTRTELGQNYIGGRLETLTGTRYQRFFLGEWVGMENAIYTLDADSMLLPLSSPVVWENGAMGVDWGRVHVSAVCAVQRDSTGIYWVREVWAEAGGNAKIVEDQARGLAMRFKIRRGRVDPIQEVLAQNLGYNVAKTGDGSRRQRIAFVESLLDTGALKFDVNGVGVRDLWDEMMAYRWEVRETDTVMERVPVRKDDDRVAALEYAVEELMTGGEYSPPSTRTLTAPMQRGPQSKPRVVAGGMR